MKISWNLSYFNPPSCRGTSRNNGHLRLDKRRRRLQPHSSTARRESPIARNRNAHVCRALRRRRHFLPCESIEISGESRTFRAQFSFDTTRKRRRLGEDTGTCDVTRRTMGAFGASIQVRRRPFPSSRCAARWLRRATSPREGSAASLPFPKSVGGRQVKKSCLATLRYLYATRRVSPSPAMLTRHHHLPDITGRVPRERWAAAGRR